MLEIGNGGMNEDESRTHMTLWCLLAAPLFAGNDLTHMSATTVSLLTNPEVIAVDQDTLGAQGHRVAQEGPLEVWMKPLANGSRAVGLFNRGWGPMPVTAEFGELGIAETAEGGKGWGRYARVRDLWARKDLGEFKNSFTAAVPQHGAMMLTVR
jgi:alpha-galactosidase